jgi:hypothetical protein
MAPAITTPPALAVAGLWLGLFAAVPLAGLLRLQRGYLDPSA